MMLNSPNKQCIEMPRDYNEKSFCMEMYVRNHEIRNLMIFFVEEIH